MIVVIAPYAPVGRSLHPHLGAARKIESVVSILGRIGPPLVLINTAHEVEESAALSVHDSVISGSPITEIIPPTYSSRRYGKFRNIFDMDAIVDALLKIGNPQLVWLYNGYALESRLGVDLQRRTGCRVVQEMEDWHFSRQRGLNPKPLFDWWFWRAAARKATHIFAVNQSLADRSRRLNPRVSLFPGVVAAGVAEIRSRRSPFSALDGIVTVGYFGGLSEEKGADRVLKLLEVMPSMYRLIVTGAGPLEDVFKSAAACSGGRLEFHGRVNDGLLNELLSRCDILLNPHSPISRMNNGVFPFKVIESVATGRLLISTTLPGEGLGDVLQGVRLVNHDDTQLLAAVLGARAWYDDHRVQVEAGSEAALNRFGLTAVLHVVREILSGPGA